jgi:hypothetical protein
MPIVKPENRDFYSDVSSMEATNDLLKIKTSEARNWRIVLYGQKINQTYLQTRNLNSLTFGIA